MVCITRSKANYSVFKTRPVSFLFKPNNTLTIKSDEIIFVSIGNIGSVLPSNQIYKISWENCGNILISSDKIRVIRRLKFIPSSQNYCELMIRGKFSKRSNCLRKKFV